MAAASARAERVGWDYIALYTLVFLGTCLVLRGLRFAGALAILPVRRVR